MSLQRAVSSLKILNENELTVFWEHVRRLRALGVTYVQAENGMEKRLIGQSDGKSKVQFGRPIRLEPEIDQLVSFEIDNEEGNEMIRKDIPSVVSFYFFFRCDSHYLNFVMEE